ncbi:MAG: hypothetical protein AAFV28_07570 [Cyanobacteria bacterium J06635_13]
MNHKAEKGANGKANNRLLLLFGVPTIVFVVFLIIIIVAFRSLGILSFSGEDPSAKVLAGAITLIGSLIASFVTFAGLILKYAIDDRNATLKEKSYSISNLQKNKEEKRLNIQAAIQAVDLLSTNDGKDVPLRQRAGAILILGELGSMRVALALCRQMLRTSELDISTACWLYDKAIKSEDEDIITQALYDTNEYAYKMLEPNGRAVFPGILLKPEVVDLKEQHLVDALFSLIDLLLLRSYAKWDDNVFFVVLGSIYRIWESEANKTDKAYSHYVAETAIKIFIQAYDQKELINLPSQSNPQTPLNLDKKLQNYEQYELDGRLYDGSLRSAAVKKWLSELPAG